MKKLLALLDNSLLKWAVLFTLVFTALYPKLPSIHIVRTWVYIRLEDFLIAGVAIIWLIQLLRRKVKLAWPVGAPIGIYWSVGLLSLLFSLAFIAPHLANFFPHVAILQYLRRIEYMVLFFVAFSTVRSVKDVRDYVIALCVSLTAVILYGFGQKFYLDVWGLFPDFFVKHPFCFPSFQTGNEEFAKGLALCLPKGSRITSTFGGHYDLAAYLVVMLPLILGIFVTVKKLAAKVGVAVLFVTGLMLLIFTASRISFTAYILGATIALIFLKQKKLLIPVIGISILMLLIFSGSTAKRFSETFRIVNVVTNNQGQVVGVAETKLPETLKKKIAKNTDLPKSTAVIVEAPPPMDNLPTGSSFITLPQTSVATTSALVRKSIPTKDSLRLKLANGGLEISTVSGSFLIQKALVYDISFTTRFQAEWPTAWAAFMKNPPLGTGYSSITLASDNDYLRLLGESGFLGFGAFALIFIILGIYTFQAVKTDTYPLTKTFALGLAGGVIGLIANASLIDVFEASKVAEPLWILLGISVGGLALTTDIHMNYLKKLKSVLTSHTFLVIYLFLLVFVFFSGGLTNFFVADDFSWLKWAATSTPHDLGKYFTDSQGFYRPLDKVVMYYMYSFFSFQPQGYHLFAIALHFLIALAWYILGLQIFKKKQWAMLLAVFFLMLPIHAETLFWISTTYTLLCALFLIFSVVFLVKHRQQHGWISYLLSFILVVGALFSYEMGIVAPLLFFVTDVFLLGQKVTKKLLLSYIPFVILDVIYLAIRNKAHVAPMGGDYAYNVSHAIPNIIGNFVGYSLTTFSGERMLSYMWTLRDAMRVYSLPVTIGIILLIAGTAYVIVKQKKQLLMNETVRLSLFGVCFAFVSLLPFLPLGNMSERYGYLAAGGFAFAVIVVIKHFFEQTKGKTVWIVGVIIFAGIALLFRGAINRELSEWQRASTITYETLGYFRLEKPYMSAGSSLYMVNMPIKYGNAWIFPVGLSDGLWFIYRDTSLKIFQEKSIGDATKAVKENPSVSSANDYIFEFDKNGEISEVDNL